MIHFSQFAFMQIEATIGSAALTGQEVVFMPFFIRKRRLWALRRIRRWAWRFHKTYSSDCRRSWNQEPGASQVLSLDTIYQLNDLIYMVRHGMRHVRAAALADTLAEIPYHIKNKYSVIL